MTKTKILGWSALAICVLGYAAFGVALLLVKLDHVAMTPGLVAAGVAALVGEIGLWVAAACLGFTILKKRKAFIDRVFRKKAATSPEV